MSNEVEGLVYKLIVDRTTGVASLRSFDAAGAKSERKARKNAAGVDKAYRKASRGVDKATKSVSTFKTRMAGLGGGIKKVAKAFGPLLSVLGIGAGIAGAFMIVKRLARAVITQFKEMISVGGEFEATMSRVGAVLRASAGEMKLLTATAKQLGATTVFTARQVADTQFTLAKAGFNTGEILGALKPTLDLAAAGQLEMAEAAGIAADSLRGMKLPVSELPRVVDVMTLATIRSNQTLRDMGESMKFAATGASLAGVSIEETSGALALMANRGIRGTLSGTQFRRMMSLLIGPLKDGAKGLGEVGKKMLVATKQGGALSSTFQALRDAGFKATDMFKLFDIRAGVGAAILFENVEALRAFEVEAKNVAGLTERIANENLDNLNGQLVLLKSATEGVRIELSTSFMPVLRGLAGGLTAVLTLTTVWVRDNVRLRTSLLNSSIAVLEIARSFASMYAAMTETTLGGDPISMFAESLERKLNEAKLAMILFRLQLALTVDSIATTMETFINLADALPGPGLIQNKLLENVTALRSAAALLRQDSGTTTSGNSVVDALETEIIRLKAALRDVSADDASEMEDLVKRLAEAQERLATVFDGVEMNKDAQFLKDLGLPNPDEATAQVSGLFSAIKIATEANTPDTLFAIETAFAQLQQKANLSFEPDELAARVTAMFDGMTMAAQQGKPRLVAAFAEAMSTFRDLNSLHVDEAQAGAMVSVYIDALAQAVERGDTEAEKRLHAAIADTISRGTEGLVSEDSVALANSMADIDAYVDSISVALTLGLGNIKPPDDFNVFLDNISGIIRDKQGEIIGFQLDYEAQMTASMLRTLGVAEDVASGMAAAWSGMLNAAKALAQVASNTDKHMKRIAKVQAAALLISGIISIKDGGVNMAKGLAQQPPDMKLVAAGLLQIANGVAAVASAKKLVSGGGGATAGASAGGGAGAGGSQQIRDQGGQRNEQGSGGNGQFVFGDGFRNGSNSSSAQAAMQEIVAEAADNNQVVVEATLIALQASVDRTNAVADLAMANLSRAAEDTPFAFNNGLTTSTRGRGDVYIDRLEALDADSFREKLTTHEWRQSVAEAMADAAEG